MLPRLITVSRHLRPAVTPIKPQSISTPRSSMSTFNLPNWEPTCKVTLTKDLEKNQLLSFIPFKNWIKTLGQSLELQHSKDHTFHEAPYRLRSITIQNVDFFGGRRIGFIKMTTEVSNDKGEKIPGSILLRGGSVAMLVCNLSPFHRSGLTCQSSSYNPTTSKQAQRKTSTS